MISAKQEKQELLKKIQVLSSKLWEDRVKNPQIDDWLTNFDNSNEEQLHALYLLSNFIYFGSIQTRELLRVIYRDLFKYPIIEKIRKENGDTKDIKFIDSEYKKQLEKTRFLGMGNPSESGAHLLYYFRQENNLPKNLFVQTHEIFSRTQKNNKWIIRNPNIEHYVFIDDFCGSGQQGVQYSQDILNEIKLNDNSVNISYFVLVAMKEGIKKVRNETLFDRAESVFSLDASFRCFNKNSRIFIAQSKSIDKETAKNMCYKYGKKLCPSAPLGYDNCQLLIGFHHNTPDNTLPIIWYDFPEGERWKPIFKRYHKNYGWGI